MIMTIRADSGYKDWANFSPKIIQLGNILTAVNCYLSDNM